MVAIRNISLLFLLTIGVACFAGTPPEAPAGPCPGTGSCCQPNGTPGCNDFTCCDLICFLDDFCCIAWGQDCADLAAGLCSAGACSGPSCPGSGDCCEANGSPSCNDATCCDLVCSVDASCCEAVWSAGCVRTAEVVCDLCGPPVERCPGDGGDCCDPAGNFTPGCDRFACCETVCDLDDFCCNVEWDDVCSSKARDNCVNVCACPMFGDLDGSGAVNLADFSVFAVCFNGNNGDAVASSCACADYDGDGDVDLDDHTAFVTVFLAP